MGALNSGLEAGLAATKNALEFMTVANSKAEATAERNASRAERNALQADRNALRAEGNACWAEAEGMRAEEAMSRRFLSDVAAAEKVPYVCGVGLSYEHTHCRKKYSSISQEPHSQGKKYHRNAVDTFYVLVCADCCVL